MNTFSLRRLADNAFRCGTAQHLVTRSLVRARRGRREGCLALAALRTQNLLCAEGQRGWRAGSLRVYSKCRLTLLLVPTYLRLCGIVRTSIWQMAQVPPSHASLSLAVPEDRTLRAHEAPPRAGQHCPVLTHTGVTAVLRGGCLLPFTQRQARTPCSALQGFQGNWTPDTAVSPCTPQTRPWSP